MKFTATPLELVVALGLLHPSVLEPDEPEPEPEPELESKEKPHVEPV